MNLNALLTPAVLALTLSALPLPVQASPGLDMGARESLMDCGYGERGLQITAVWSRGVSCSRSWDVVSRVHREILASWDGDWFQDLYKDSKRRSFRMSGWRCSVRVVSHKGFRMVCSDGHRKIRDYTGA